MKFLKMSRVKRTAFSLMILVFATQTPLILEADTEMPRLTVYVQGAEGKTLDITGTKEEIWEYAEGFTDQGNYEYAKAIYEGLIEQDPRDIRTYLLLGQLYQFQLGKYADALWYYKRAERLVPPANPGGIAFCQRLSAEAYRSLAEKTNSLIYFVQAIGEYEKILRFDPDDVEVIYYLASCRLNSRDYDHAISLFKEVIEKDPESVWSEMSKKAVEIARQESRRNRFPRNRRR